MKTTLIILFVGAFAVFSVMVKNELRRDKSPLQSLQIGQPMPDFTLVDSSGKEYTLSKIIGKNKLVLINFWASWCAPCRLEMPGFEKLQASKGKDGLLILAINEDEDRSQMDAYLKEKPMSFPVLLDPASVLMTRLGGRALPTTILVGGDGKIREVTEGVQEYLDATVEGQLKAGAGAE
jgi:cytochrome c biogenesis protein CcmG/thiol:disulfide interchange protein DsbE